MLVESVVVANPYTVPLCVSIFRIMVVRIMVVQAAFSQFRRIPNILYLISDA